MVAGICIDLPPNTGLLGQPVAYVMFATARQKYQSFLDRPRPSGGQAGVHFCCAEIHPWRLAKAQLQPYSWRREHTNIVHCTGNPPNINLIAGHPLPLPRPPQHPKILVSPCDPHSSHPGIPATPHQTPPALQSQPYHSSSWPPSPPSTPPPTSSWHLSDTNPSDPAARPSPPSALETALLPPAPLSTSPSPLPAPSPASPAHTTHFAPRAHSSLPHLAPSHTQAAHTR